MGDCYGNSNGDGDGVDTDLGAEEGDERRKGRSVGMGRFLFIYEEECSEKMGRREEKKKRRREELERDQPQEENEAHDTREADEAGTGRGWHLLWE